MSEYAERNTRKQGEAYTKHILAMTAEDLHSKADIAAELAHRDIQISQLQDKLKQLEGDLKAIKSEWDKKLPYQDESGVVCVTLQSAAVIAEALKESKQ